MTLTPQQALQQYFGLDQFREGQAETIQRVLNGQHTLLVMPTGSGKSLAYQLPAMLLPGLTLIISPLIALMKDQVDSLVESGLPATYINSSLPADEANRRLKAVREGYVKLLYIAPERLRSRQFTRALAQVKVSLLAVDEAHCISQWGHDFRPDYLQIGPIWQAMAQPTLLATTATATPNVQKDIVKLLDLPQAQTIVTGFNRPNLTFRVKPAPDDRLKRQYLQDILGPLDGSAIVYAATRRNAEEVADFIRSALQRPAQAYHGGLDRDLRHRVQTDFMADRIKVVVATNAFGMGIDKADVRAVVHYNLPATVEAYYQEAGRAGRDAQPAECVLLFSPDDQGLQEWLIRADTPAYADLQQVYALLSQAANNDEVYFTGYELAEISGLPAIKLRVTLSELELAGAILHLGDEAGHSHWKILPPTDDALQERAKAVERRARIRLDLLGRMLDYAYLTTCRRQFLLDYFGDTTPPQSPRCCDNHTAASVDSLPRAVTPQEWLPLIVLDTVRSLSRRPVGRKRLVQLLSGSQAKGVQGLGFDRHRFYGKFQTLNQSQITGLIDALIAARYLRQSGGNLPVLTLTPLGVDALKARAALPITVPGLNMQTSAPQPGRHERGATVRVTLDLFRQDLTPAQIAAKRDLTVDTVYVHLARLIQEGQLELRQVVSTDLEAQIAQAIATAETTAALSPIKALLPDDISYGQIRCVLAAYTRQSDEEDEENEEAASPAAAKTPAQTPVQADASQKPVASPLALPDPTILEALRQWRTEQSRQRKVSAFVIFSNRVLEAIASCRPVTLEDLAAIPGIGPAKLAQYGEVVLKIVQGQSANSDEEQSANSKLETENEMLVSAEDEGTKELETENYPVSSTKRQPESVNRKSTPVERTASTPLDAILTIVTDLDGLLTPAGLAELLTAAPGAIVSFSDHDLCGAFHGVLTTDELAAHIEQAVKSGRMELSPHGRLTL